MTYQDTLNWLFSQLPMYQREGKIAYKSDLSNTLKLAKHLNYPEKDFKSIHIAGTNGKGSTSHMLASVLQEAGYKVGLYTSPHLKDFRERIRINGKVIPKDNVVEFVNQNKTFFEENRLSFFEMTVGMAFNYFSKEKIDIAVIEVGMGGRLDSTNIITPEVSVITNIGLDHTQFLGSTLEKIAFEKGGIIKDQVPVVIGETQQETSSVFQELAKRNKAQIIFADQQKNQAYKTDLLGDYQVKNIKTTVAAITVLRDTGFKVSDEDLTKGLKHVTKNTGLLGRWQVLKTGPKVVCDTGHNQEGLAVVMNQISKEDFTKLHMVFGVVNDKDLSTIMGLLPKEATYYFCKPNIPRGLSAKALKRVFEENGLLGEAFSSVNQAYKTALKNALKDDFIFVGGSTFVVAEII